MSGGLRRSLHSLAVPNFRRYFTGQAISLAGTWMQTVAETWLVLRLTGSGVALGISTALQFAPVLVAGAWGGLLADRLPKRRAAHGHAGAHGRPRARAWALTAFGDVQVWVVFALIFARGIVTAVDNPTRQSFVSEMVDRDHVLNAVSLNSVLVQTARIVGPALAARGHRDARRRRHASWPTPSPSPRCSSRCTAWTPPQLQPAPVTPRGRGSSATRCGSSATRPRCARRCCSSRSSGRCPSTSRSCCRCWPASPCTAARRPTRC